MIFNHDLYNLTQEFQGALIQGAVAAQPPPPSNPNLLLQLRRGYAESPAWLMIQAEEFDPEPLSVERLRVRAIWSSERIVRGMLDLMASEKWFDRVGDDYHLTDDGRGIIRGLTERRQNILSALIPHLNSGDLDRLEHLMRRLLDGSMDTTEPPGKWCLRYSRRRTLSAESPIVFKLFQYCADFNAYRDDSHMAAFQPLGIEAYAWEAFSEIWRGTTDNSQGVFDALSYRGYSQSEFAEGLRAVAERTWLTTDDDEHYRITEMGRSIREEAERKTDDYFYAPWRCLTDSEAQELETKMQEMKSKLEGIQSPMD